MQVVRWSMGATLVATVVAVACGGGDDADRDTSSAPSIADLETPAEVQADFETPAGVEAEPSPVLRASAFQLPVVSTYVVEAGDTLGAIAPKVGVTIASLIESNQLADPNMLSIGQELRVVRTQGPTIVPDGPQADALVRVEVVSVTDGDTIRVRLPDGTEEAVRYIGIDAPEEAGVFATVATARNGALVGGGFVFLEADGSDRDEFNRLLRYVWIEESNLRYRLVNAALVVAGFARVTSLPPEAKHRDLFLALQDAAQTAGLGIWRGQLTTEPDSAGDSAP